MASPISTRLTATFAPIALFTALAAFSAPAARAAAASGDSAPIDQADGSFTIADEEGLRFSDATASVQEGDQVAISATVTMTDAGGRQKTSQIIAILIGLVVDDSNGFMDYTDDACMENGRLASWPAPARACAAMGRAWNRYLHLHMGALSPAGIKWDTPDYDAGIVSPRDPASGLTAQERR